MEARLSSHSESVSMVAKVLGRLPSMPPNVVLCTDDTLPTDLVRRGHLNHVVSKCVSEGIRAEDAIRMATLNAMRFGLRDRAISPEALISALFPSSKHAHYGAFRRTRSRQNGAL